MLKDRRLIVLGVAALIAVGVWSFALLKGGKTLELTVMDVGEGLCVVMRSPAGRIMVMDCGTCSWRNNDRIGASLVVPYLRSFGADHIDLAVLSHPHADHLSGYPGLLEETPAKLVLDIGARHPSPIYKQFLEEVRRSGATYRVAKRGQEIDMGAGVVVQVLNPDPAGGYSNLNDRSIVLRVVYGETSFLLAADAEEEAERRMLESGMTLRSDVLQVGHHGSRTSSSPEWVAAVKPRAAVISCGSRNTYGHPSRLTINRMRAAGAKVYRTDMDGAVQITSDGRSVRLRTFTARQ
jgi:competence protein ComEC